MYEDEGSNASATTCELIISMQVAFEQTVKNANYATLCKRLNARKGWSKGRPPCRPIRGNRPIIIN